MIDFQQYLGFLIFLGIFLTGFWLMLFLVNFVFYWVGGALWEGFKEKRNRKNNE